MVENTILNIIEALDAKFWAIGLTDKEEEELAYYASLWQENFN